MRLTRWIGVTAIAVLGSAGCDRGSRPNQIGQQAPTFTLTDGAQTLSLAQWRGHVVLLNFWASWCAPCVEELPSLIDLQHQVPQMQVIAISTDDDAEAYKRFLSEHRVDLLTIRDGEQKSNTLYGSFRYPETYVIDKQGIVRRKFIGPQEWTKPEIEDFLRKLAA